MFNSVLSFSENIYGYLGKKPEEMKDVPKMNTMPYNLELFPKLPDDSRSCRLKLIPTNLSDTSVNPSWKQKENQSRKKRSRRCRRNDYREGEGEVETTEQSINNSVFFNFQNKQRGIFSKKYANECRNKSDSYIQNETSIHNTRQLIDNISSQCCGEPPGSHDYFSKPNLVLEPKPVLGQRTYQVYRSEMSQCSAIEAPVDVEPCEGHCFPEPPPPPPKPKSRPKITIRHRGKEDDIKLYWTKRNLAIQTSMQSIRPRSSSKTSRRGSKGTSFLSVVKDVGCGSSIPCIRVKTDDGKEVCVRAKCEKVLSTKCFPPLEIPPCNLSCGECKIVGDTDPKVFAKFDDDCDCKRPKKIPSCIIKKIPVGFKKSRAGLPITQPVLGYCNSCQCGTYVQSLQYAMTKISRFLEFTIYEVMQPYETVPKNIPVFTAEIFVVSNQDQTRVPSTKISFRESSPVRVCSQQEEVQSVPRKSVSKQPPVRVCSHREEVQSAPTKSVSKQPLVKVCSHREEVQSAPTKSVSKQPPSCYSDSRVSLQRSRSSAELTKTAKRSSTKRAK